MLLFTLSEALIQLISFLYFIYPLSSLLFLIYLSFVLYCIFVYCTLCSYATANKVYILAMILYHTSTVNKHTIQYNYTTNERKNR